ncbi:MAG: DNA-binding protein [Mangrovibacterium sp.]|nr:DNA-binding protein [Mangrovibacterium sp.]
MNYLGNKDILKNHKTAFLCSRQCTAQVVLKSFDWAREQREAKNCIICGNHSQIEKDVFGILLRGDQPLILVLARGMKTRWEPAIEAAIEKNRLLVISSFPKEVKRITKETAEMRNENILSLADEITIGYKTQGGQLEKLLLNHTFTAL